jgi:anti-sigma regulatory factor (Ser/Thr protein kinase)
MPPTFQRTFSRNVDSYLSVAEELERFCSQRDLPKPVSFKVRLVLEELVLNLIDHAVGSATDRIDLRIELEPGQVILVLEDDSDPFDPRQVPAFDKEKPLEHRRPRGMGIHLVRTMAEEIVYQRIGGINQLRVVLRY